MPESRFNKVAGHRAATLLKKGLWQRCFPVNFAKFLRIPPVTAFFSSNNKDELRDLHHQVGYMSSPLIPAEAVEKKNNQEHLVANKVFSITLL